MKTSFVATVALALFAIPAVASAASLQYDPSAGNNGQQFVDSFFNDHSANADAAKADAARYAQAAGAKVITSYDPNAGSNDPQFASRVVIENPANATAAKADAARYAEAAQAATSGAMIGTHGSTGAKLVTTYDPAADQNQPQFTTSVVLGE